MKFGKQYNQFRGAYYHESSSEPIQNVPIGERILLVLLMIVFFCGVGLTLFFAMLEKNRWSLTCMGAALGLFFLGMAAFLILYSRRKGGSNLNLTVCLIFGAIGLFAILFSVLAQFLSVKMLLITASFLVMPFTFISLGIVMLINGLRQRNIIANVYTQPVRAVCLELDAIQENRFQGDSDSAHDTSSAPEVKRPVWRYVYSGAIYHASPKYYTGGLEIKAGDQMVLYVNPEHPEQFVCEKNSTYKLLIGMGVAFIAVTLLLIPILLFLLISFSGLMDW